MEFSGFVIMDGIAHARFIAPSGEPELMTRAEVELRRATASCPDAERALRMWPGSGSR